MPVKSDYHWFTVEQKGEVTVVRFKIARLLKEGTVEVIGDEILDLVKDPAHRKLVLDLSTVERVYSVVVGKIAALHKKLQAEGGRLALCQLQPEVYEVFEVLQLHQHLNIYNTLEEALQSF